MDGLLLLHAADNLVHLCTENRFSGFLTDKVEHHNVLADSVQNFRTAKLQLEVIFNGTADGLGHLIIIHVHGHVGMALAQGILHINAEIAGEDDDGFGKIDRVALPIRHPAVLQNLQELVQYAGVGFFDFVEQKNREGILLYGIGQLTAGLIAYIAGGRTHQLLVGVALPVFAHVKANTAGFISEELLCQCFGGFCFARACRPCKEEHALRFGGGGAG